MGTDIIMGMGTDMVTVTVRNTMVKMRKNPDLAKSKICLRGKGVDRENPVKGYHL